ncbi:TonB-dependent receptor [Sphingomonas sp. RT2P30]|uniref:TonB-dependent receptor n=1 Tax=Parasphingomonas halimpatiens TaxID=3096162 RepID=UPI002FC74C6C
MKTKLFTGVAFAAMMIPGAAFAQSTGSTDMDQGDVVVTAARPTKGIAGVQIPEGTKAKGVLTQEFIAKQTPGNSILDTINMLPGVSFQNNDPFGSAGGTLTIRGFDSSRIGLTFDGIPLNDTGNYAVYSNQQLDPELIEQVNVNYGSTDVDSPSAAASGSTVNYRTIVPTDKFGARFLGSVGDYNFFRVFGLINTGEFTSLGTKAWFSASSANNHVVFNDFGKINKSQFNARIYQPLGSNGDFLSLSGNYNVNRNNFFGSAPLRQDTNVYTSSIVGGVPTLVAGAARTPGTGSGNRFPASRDELPYHVARCQMAVGRTGLADSPLNVADVTASNNGSACGSSFDERYNPSNTGSVRFGSKFTLAPSLVLTVDASYQYTKANGGGTVTGSELTGTLTNPPATLRPTGSVLTGYLGSVNVGQNTGNTPSPGAFSYFTGIDLNGDGDKLDTVTLLAPSETKTHRYGMNASLRYEINEDNTIRVAFAYDRGKHKQTGELGYLLANGVPMDVFPENNPIRDALGNVMQKRDRLSYATLTQVSGEYRGNFGGLTVNLGIRAPWFKRQLNQRCFTVAANGNVDCIDQTQVAAFAAANPYSFNATTNLVTGFQAPNSRTYKYNRVLPNIGLSYKFEGGFMVFANYSKGIQVPGTDNLYQDMYFPTSSAQANPTPETTDNFDAGIRYSSPTVQAEIGPWYTKFTNRLAGAFDQDTQTTIYRNLGRVDKYGIDASISYRPIRELTLYVFGSYLKSEIKNNVLLGTCSTTTTANCTTLGAPIYALTAGKRESGSPTYTFGGRIAGSLGPIDLAVQAKRTGPRYVNDQNLPNLQCTGSVVNSACPTTSVSYQVFGAKTPAYTQVDIDARIKMGWAGLNDTTYIQLNVQNLFNEYYVGGFSGGQTTQYTVPFVQIGSPRAFIASLNVQF